MKTYLLKLTLIITCLTISGHFYTAHAQNNKEELDADDFFMNLLGGIGGDMDNEKKAPVPLPSTFSFINKFVVDMPDGDKLGLYFIDTNNDVSNFEMFEYAHVKKDNQVVTRGIVKGVYFTDLLVRLHGIRLSYEDSDDYTPHGEFLDRIVSTDFQKFIRRILYEKSNNNSIRFIEEGTYYHVGNDVKDYKKSLGIIK